MGINFRRICFISILVLSLIFSQAVFAQESTGSTDSDLDYLKSVMDTIKERYNGEITDKQLIEGALKGMFGTMDPYTTYFNLDEAKEFLGTMNGTYEGIGIVMSKKDDYIMVLKVFPDSPAEKAGIVQGDMITAVDGKNVVGASTEEVSNLVKGETGTKVILGIIRQGRESIEYVELQREEIKINPVTYEIKGNVGYIRLDIFNANASEFIAQALNEMDKNGISKIILDLRNNPGGEVDQAVLIARKFVPEGLITRLDFKSESKEDEEYYSKLSSSKYKLAILVNGMSASASEILAGAVQDTGAGTIIGTKTFGKAKVQSLIPLLTPEAYKNYEEKLGVKVIDGYDLITKYRIIPKNSEIIGWSKITTGLYYTPKGRMIDGTGIQPDVAVDDPVAVSGIDVNGINKLSVINKPSLNSESTDVYNAEKILKVMGYDIDSPDTKLDEKTFKAIAEYQKDSKLWPYGVLDFTTQKALNGELEKLVLKYDKQYEKAVELLNQ